MRSGEPKPAATSGPSVSIAFRPDPMIATDNSINSASANSGASTRSTGLGSVSGSSSPPTYATTNTYRTITAPA